MIVIGQRHVTPHDKVPFGASSADGDGSDATTAGGIPGDGMRNGAHHEGLALLLSHPWLEVLVAPAVDVG